MKTLISTIALASCLACSSTSDKSPTANEPTAKGGWEQMKEGGSKTAEGAGEVATATGQSIKEGAEEAGHAIKASACPVVGDKTTRRYYTKAYKQYDVMLKGEKVTGTDNRECFMSEDNARKGGYQAALH